MKQLNLTKLLIILIVGFFVYNFNKIITKQVNSFSGNIDHRVNDKNKISKSSESWAKDFICDVKIDQPINQPISFMVVDNLIATNKAIISMLIVFKNNMVICMLNFLLKDKLVELKSLKIEFEDNVSVYVDVKSNEKTEINNNISTTSILDDLFKTNDLNKRIKNICLITLNNELLVFTLDTYHNLFDANQCLLKEVQNNLH